MRLQKYLAHAGVASRRTSEELILNGRVKVNGEVVTELGYKVDPLKDKVYFDDKKLKLVREYTYVMINKPIGIVSTAKDEKNRKTVLDLVPSNERIYPIGRLDIDTTGLLILTNDGELANKLMHPRKEIDKVYIATVEGTPSKSGLDKLRNGITIDGYKLSKSEIKILKSYDTDSIVRVTIHEGRNRQVKKMFERIGNPVKKLKRISFGPIELANLEIGAYRYLTNEEIKELKSLWLAIILNKSFLIY